MNQQTNNESYNDDSITITSTTIGGITGVFIGASGNLGIEVIDSVKKYVNSARPLGQQQADVGVEVKLSENKYHQVLSQTKVQDKAKTNDNGEQEMSSGSPILEDRFYTKSEVDLKIDNSNKDLQLSLKSLEGKVDRLASAIENSNAKRDWLKELFLFVNVPLMIGILAGVITLIVFVLQIRFTQSSQPVADNNQASNSVQHR